MILSAGWRLRLAVSAISLAVAAVAAEGAFRWIDGYRLTSWSLQQAADTPQRSIEIDRTSRTTVPLAPGVDPAWFDLDPAVRPRVPIDEELRVRAEAYPEDSITPFLVFNRRYVEERVCAGSDAFGRLRDVYVFDPVEPTQYPTFRHLPHVNPPGWFPTNNFGWRGPDVSPRKPAGTIRIAFVGASTTVDAFGVPFSHPELVEHWLNLWMRTNKRSYRVEVINAGRTGIDSSSIAAIVRQELAPLDVDLVVFYEGANQFWPGQIVSYRFGRLYRKPTTAERTLLIGDATSAAVRRVERLIDRVRGGNGLEPLKPTLTVHWPEGVDEQHPDASDRRLPMDLPRVVADLENMRATLEASGGELAVSSFIWLVHDQLRLDPKRHREIYRYLNSNYWPLTYAHLRRMSDFQNRVFESYARAHGLPLIDIARSFPQDPDLFDDAIHMNAAGLRLQAWMYLQALVPIVDERIGSGRWPRAASDGVDGARAFVPPDRQKVVLADVRRSCR